MTQTDIEEISKVMLCRVRVRSIGYEISCRTWRTFRVGRECCIKTRTRTQVFQGYNITWNCRVPARESRSTHRICRVGYECCTETCIYTRVFTQGNTTAPGNGYGRLTEISALESTGMDAVEKAVLSPEYYYESIT